MEAVRNEKIINKGGIYMSNDELCERNIQINNLQQTVRDIKVELANAREERVKTIEAHQSRISQLQTKFQIDISNKFETQTKNEVLIRNELASENEIALENQRVGIENVLIILIFGI
jgi:hypothetical protein